MVPAAGVVVESYPVDGIQNGSPDGIALVAPGGTVAEYLTYEGTFAAVGGPANGLTGTDIGVAETTTTPVGSSLQKVGGTWRDAAPNTFGVRNAGGDPDPDPDPDPVGCDVTVDHTIAAGPGHRRRDSAGRHPGHRRGRGDRRPPYRRLQRHLPCRPPAAADGTPAAGTASDGIFVYLTTNAANHPSVAVGDRVRVSGTASEFNGLTQLTIGAKADVQVCEQGVALPAPVALSLPLDPAGRESAESMLVAPVGAYTVSEVYNTNRYGEVVLAAGDRAAASPPTWPAPAPRGTAGRRREQARPAAARRRPDHQPRPPPALLPPYLSPTSPLRVGDQVEAFGPTVLSYGFNEWRLQPTTPVSADTPPAGRTTFKSTNPRTAAPENVGGDLRLASFNVLNYFVHFGGDARGADDEAGLAKQEAKIVSAINALGADVVALEEIENSVRFDAADPQQALKRLVAALNTAAGAGTWDYVRSPAQLPAGDRSRTSSPRRSSSSRRRCTPKGESRTINDESVWFNAREPIAQTFTSGAVTFTVVANHLKSKSTSASAVGDNADTGDGQGAFNGDRVRQARSLATFVDQLKTDSGSDDVLLLGDFNAYTHEDPMQVLYDKQYVDLNTTGEASYVFGGESGSLDHAIASPSLASRVTGDRRVADQLARVVRLPVRRPPGVLRAEPVPGQRPQPDRGRAQHRRPSGQPAAARASTTSTVGWSPRRPSNGQPVGGAAQLAGLVNQLRAQNPNTAFVSAGDNIGASTFISAIDGDNPTIDALNQMGVVASAVGNHEFDKGIADLTGRVTDRADFPLLGANVYRGDERALPAYSVSTVGGVKVGFIGVVTEQTEYAGQPGRHRRPDLPGRGARRRTPSPVS